jgi:hypothetical protein
MLLNLLVAAASASRTSSAPDSAGPIRVLLINGSPRSEHTFPGEMSKNFRLTQLAREVFEASGAAVEFLSHDELDSDQAIQEEVRNGAGPSTPAQRAPDHNNEPWRARASGASTSCGPSKGVCPPSPRS